MNLPQSLNERHTPEPRSTTFTVYRTPSSRDAADTAEALTQHASLRDFLPPAKVVQSAPGVYEVRVTYVPGDASFDASACRAAINKVLSRILLDRLPKIVPALPLLGTAHSPGHSAVGSSLWTWYTRAYN